MRKMILALLLVLAALTYACDGDGGLTGPGDEQEIALELVAQGLTSPVMAVEPPDGSGRLFILDQVGTIRIVGADGKLMEEPFLSVKDRMVDLMDDFDERGLLGLAFHPDYQTNGRFFVYYSAPPRIPNYDNTSRVSEFRVMAGNANKADPGSERIVIQEDQPQFNHEGGTLAFGPDGHLYISWGDGGGRDDEGGDPFTAPPKNTPVFGHVDDWYDRNAGGNGQDIAQNRLGNILRIDVNSGDPYAIPPDNPFVGKEGLDEIYAYGLRNPYRFSFDVGGDRALLAGDAGQDLWEEVNVVVKGGNYGWNVKEGTHCFDAENPKNPPASCPSTVTSGIRQGDPLIDPVIEFKNAGAPGGGLGLVVVGGYVYRGDDLRGMDGQYFFGTWSAEHEVPDGRVFVATPRTGPGLWDFREVNFTNTPTGNVGAYLLGFGQGLDGELYVLTSATHGPHGHSGKVYKLVAPRE